MCLVSSAALYSDPYFIKKIGPPKAIPLYECSAYSPDGQALLRVPFHGANMYRTSESLYEDHISTIYETAELILSQICDGKITLPCRDLNPGLPWSPVHEADNIPKCHHASIAKRNFVK